MSLHKLTAGDGYEYLTRQVAAMDSTEKGHTGLASYYTQKGETPGVWVGSGMAGIEGLRFNDWRHGFATDLLEAGIPERIAMKAMGHANASTHQIYANLDERISRQIAEALDRLHAQRRGDEIHHPASEMIQ